MAALNGEQPISITLSVEELLVVLNTLETATIPGLEVETWTDLSPEQQDLALSVARRALEARGLAEIDQFGQLLVHRALLNAVGVCAYPHQTTLIDHWSTEGAPQRWFAHTRENDSVVHTANRGLHTFTLLSSEAALAKHLVAACEWASPTPAGPPLELTVPREDFTRACDASATGAEAEALKVLTGATGPTPAGSALVHALASAPRISIVQMLRPDAGAGGQEQSFTLIDGGNQGWLVATATDEANAPLKARTVSGAEVGTALLRGL